MPNVFISSKIGSQWRTISGHPQPIECMDICVLSQAHGSELRDSNVYQHIVKNLFGYFSLKSAWIRALGWHLLGFFFSEFF